MGIGKTLSNILEEKNSNPNELAEKIGISPSTIYSIIKRDNMKVDISILARICRELNIKMERFYDEYISEQTNLNNLQQNLFNIDIQQLLKNYENLNNEGKSKLINYSRDLVDSGNYSNTITVIEAARSQNNDVPVKIVERTEEDLKIFDIAPQSDEEL